MEMNTLQQQIERRAARRLDNDIATISRFLNQEKLLRSGATPGVHLYNEAVPGRPDIVSILSLFSSGGTYSEQLKVVWLPIYIKEETELFLKEFDDIKERMANLESAVDNLPQQH